MSETTISRRRPWGSEPTIHPLSPSQERFWILDKLDPDHAGNKINPALRMRGPLNAAALHRSLNEIVARHEILRTTFDRINGELRQIVSARLELELVTDDLSEFSTEKRETELVRRLRLSRRQRFDLVNGPLIRARLLKLANDDHVLLLIAHHIVFDGLSPDVLYRELQRLYPQFCLGGTSELPPLERQYRDYAEWMRQRVVAGDLEPELAYWAERLGDGPPALGLPTDRPRTRAEKRRGDTVELVLSGSRLERLRALRAKEKTSLTNLLLATFKVLLSRYTGQSDICIGMSTGGRSSPELKSLLGVFINTVALRTDLSDDPTFREFLKRFREVTSRAYRYSEIPFETVLAQIQAKRRGTYGTFPEIMCSIVDVSRVDLDMSPLTLERINTPPQDPHFELTFYVYKHPDETRVILLYDTALFDRSTIERMVEHYRTLLDGVLASPEASLSELPMLTPAERRRILVEWNATGRDHPRDLCVHELFEARARRSPDAVAAEFETQRLTYAELDARANRLARHLCDRGVGPETRVGLCIERSMDLLVGVLATLKAGGAYVPLDPWLPGARLAGMLEDSRPAAVLTDSQVLETTTELVAYADSTSVPAICVDRDAEGIAGQTPESPAVRVDPENLAYVIYTSGSTGRPKGVGIPHRAVVNFLESMRREPGLEDGDTWLAVTNLTFDIAVLELMLPLGVGARVVVASRETVVDGLRLKDELSESGATVMQATPATWRMLVQSGWSGTPGLKMLCGGEALPRPLALELLDRGGELWNMYGPTETTIWSSVARVQRRTGPISIGRPIDNTRIYVLDPNLEPVPVGVAGELYIGGAGLARGYHARPELTASSFVPSAFGDEAGERLYRTGDSVRYRADGSLEFLGRNDHQVKLRGVRIELGEIEATLLEHPEVRECVVHSFEPAPEDRRLAAYVVPANGSPPSVDDLRSFLRQSLPEYMVPSAFVTLDELPLSSNGKVDRRALPVPEYTAAREHVAPGSETEKAIAEIWHEILGRDEVGLHDDFFELGGHSLQAARILSRVWDNFEVRLPVGRFFRQPTVAGLAQFIDGARWVAPGREDRTPAGTGDRIEGEV